MLCGTKPYLPTLPSKFSVEIKLKWLLGWNEHPPGEDIECASSVVIAQSVISLFNYVTTKLCSSKLINLKNKLD